MKNAWEVRKLGEICEIELGKTPSRSDNSLWDGEKKTTNVWLSIADLLNVEENIASDSKEYITDKAARVSKIVKAGTLLASFKLTLGRLAFSGRDLFTNEAIAAISIKNEKYLDKYYLYYFLSSIDWDALTEGDVKIKGKTLNKAKLKEIEIHFPKLIKDQLLIVSTLHEAHAALDQAKGNIKRNLQNARDIFKSELHNIFTNNGEEWVEKKLSDIALIFGRGKSRHRPRNDEKLYGGIYPFIQTGDVRNSNKIIIKHTQTYNGVGLAQSKLWPKGTICITIAANIAETGILAFDSCFPDSMIGLVVNPKIADVNFAYYALQYMKTELQLLGKGSAQDNINLGTFESQTFPFPPIETQREIVRKLDTLSVETNNLEELYQQKLNTLGELKKSILHKAFSGQLTEKEVAA